MSEAIYRKLANVLNSLPNGFPSTPDGLEIKCLKMVFAPEEAELFCDLKLTPETVEQIAARTGRPLAGLEDQLLSMCKHGEIVGFKVGTSKLFAMIPWAPGIVEFQINRMDREFCELTEQYHKYFMPTWVGPGPAPMQTVPIGESVTADQRTLPFAEIPAILENGKSFRVGNCYCRTEREIVGAPPCTKPKEVCLTISSVAGVENLFDWGREITKEQAYQVLRDAEAAGLVHLTTNVSHGNTFICNCCSCCCGILRSRTEHWGEGLINSHFYAVINPDDCNNCGVCKDERCQVNAIEETDLAYQVVKARCIGCGLCVTTCPTDAVTLVHKSPDETVLAPENQHVWDELRAQRRGTNHSAYK